MACSAVLRRESQVMNLTFWVEMILDSYLRQFWYSPSPSHLTFLTAGQAETPVLGSAFAHHFIR
eukprot:COSAG03_NODE_9761_length_695_cov_0.994966_1_plen_63_part_10